MATRSECRNSTFGFPAEFFTVLTRTKVEIFRHYSSIRKCEEQIFKKIHPQRKYANGLLLPIYKLCRTHFIYIGFKRMALKFEKLVESTSKLNKISIKQRYSFDKKSEEFNEMFVICT